MAKNKKRANPEELSNVALNPDKQEKFEDDIRKKRKEKGSTLKPGIICLSHIPWGFFEHGIRDYFNQFGKVSRLRISRSKKTGNSRGFAYIEFASEDVARIAAEAMNNYLMFGKLLKCRFMDKVHPKVMKGANRKFRKPMTHTQDAKKHNKIKTETQQTRSIRRFLESYKKKMSKLEALGINYEFDSIKQLQEKLKSETKSDTKHASPGVSVEENPRKKKLKIPSEVHTPKPTNLKIPSEVHTPKPNNLKIPSEVHTPKGILQVLKEDSSDEEIAFKTPPFSIKSSKLIKKSTEGKRKCKKSTEGKRKRH